MVITTPVASREAARAAHWPVPEERRTVTVLFVDIVGSTGLVERLDPEDVRTLQRVYFGTVSGVLRRWRGVVEKYVGDAVMALFGAPDCDGFDAYRAVRAGLEIQAALDRRSPVDARLRVRVGVATGEVLVDLTGARDGGHGAASGAVITTAARLQEYAPPGGVVVCPVTRRAVAGLVEQRPLATVTMAGKTLPLDVWRVTGVSPYRPARHRGPLVGRRRELAGAADAVTRALRERRPRWITVSGPPGSGRSRLLHELTRAVTQVDGTAVRWCVAHCPPYPDGDLAPLADLVRALLAPGATGRPATVRALPGSAPGAAGWAATSPALAAFLAAPRDATAAARAVVAVRELLLDRAAGSPVVVAVDDLDRAAPALHRFLGQLFTAAGDRGLALAVVTTHGSGRADPRPAPAARPSRIWLPPLGARDTGRLLRHLLDRAGRPAALAAALLPLVGGNPAVASAYAVGDEPAGVPAPVRRLVDARLDRLDGAQRAVLMAGAVVGGTLAASTVERMLAWPAGQAGPVLRALAAAGLLRRAGTVPVPGPGAGGDAGTGSTAPNGARGWTGSDTGAGGGGRRTDVHPRGRGGAYGWTIVEPVVARVAAHRLPRAVRADFVRRLTGGAPVTAIRTGGTVAIRSGAAVGPGTGAGVAARPDIGTESGSGRGARSRTGAGVGWGARTAPGAAVGTRAATGTGVVVDTGAAVGSGTDVADRGVGGRRGVGVGRQRADRPDEAPAARPPAPVGTGVPGRGAEERATCPLGAGRSRRSGGGARPAPVPPPGPDGAGARRSAAQRSGYADPAVTRAEPSRTTTRQRDAPVDATVDGGRRDAPVDGGRRSAPVDGGRNGPGSPTRIRPVGAARTAPTGRAPGPPGRAEPNRRTAASPDATLGLAA
ncbi:adenylate/guanylate cyclase domain-containing protein [Micromonospora schwarzwaldensis]|uniref:adenylate/guanylate cyclase domain-containing protein n=1 Tax=Micromonospora sp. DSM 45708 TaxID=3111767 RepID=UPI0031D1222C